MRIYLFLRSIIWTSVLSVVSIVASLISAFIAPDFAVPFGLAAVALASLSPRRSDY